MMKNTTSRRDTTDARQQASAEGIIASKRESTNQEKKNDSKDNKHKQELRGKFAGLEVVHVTPGRIRIRAQKSEQIDLLSGVAVLLRPEDGFIRTSINQSTQSLVITFAEEQITSAVVLKILEKLGIPDVSSEQHKMPEDPFATWKSATFWQEQGIDLIPLLLGLAVTGRLGINGFAAIPVYLITAEAARKVINYLQPQVSAFLRITTAESLRENNQINNNQTNKNQIYQNIIKNPIFKRIKTQIQSHLHSPTAKIHQNQEQGEKTPKTSAKTSSSVEHRPKLSTQELLTREKTQHSAIQTESTSFQNCSIQYSVVHAIPGRVRFNVPRLGVDRVYARNLQKLLTADQQVTNVRINPDAASVAIAYTPIHLDISHWLNVLMLADPQTAIATPEDTQVTTTKHGIVTKQVGEEASQQQPTNSVNTNTCFPGKKQEKLGKNNVQNLPSQDALSDSGSIESDESEIITTETTTIIHPPEHQPHTASTSMVVHNAIHSATVPVVNHPPLSSPNQTNNDPGFWTDFKSPALSYSLAFMANFPLD